MRYESMVIVDPIKGRSETDRICEDLRVMIEKCGGSNVDIEKYGERKLAYRVKKYKRGYYFLIHFDMDSESISKYRRELKLNDEIFRYLILCDEDAAYQRRDLERPITFNVDALGNKNRFERFGGDSRDRDFSETRKEPHSTTPHNSNEPPASLQPSHQGKEGERN